MYTASDIDALNARFATATPQEVISYAIAQASKAIITTNFRPYEGVLLHAVTQVAPQLPVVWCDSGYNTKATYTHAQELIETLDLQIDLYVPKQTRAHRDILMGIPSIDDPQHAVFTEQVKIEPFTRAMGTQKPDVWFTNLRKGQTALRDSLDIFSVSKAGVLKVSPFYNYSDSDLDVYLKEHNLPNETDYYDPTKVLAHRECGIHL
ncbi:phosphoadenosine phosphosulfate reductase domain-containing protein [Dokdonia donghaensis]|uniref:Phosphoadenylylsulfate reductase n=1 Tax=Dokdonia donghaensis DSW-1 TaxID=1300343 RepID=A0A0A2H5J5_9FLAO|nr:phosphoadenosine phosphosulfate reductase family protein [Dokdonia donghaensis]ANH60635.1 Phosphoadenosine phosphosulfate reductase [Dokdonia donghaensis DSW-1]KGO07875.1 phosphoadenylylsulfate reductase [Dokdonia donghaensis DSW-1]